MRGIKYRRGSRKWKRQINKGKNTEKFIMSTPHNKPQHRNKRIYPAEELLSQLTCERTQQFLDHKPLLGECEHPLSTELARQQTTIVRTETAQ